MKTSNKIIIGILLGVFALSLLFAIIFRINSHRFALIEKNDTGTAIIIKTPTLTSQDITDINLKEVNSLIVDGVVNITVKRSKTHKIKLISDETNTVKFYQMNNTLHIRGIKRSKIIITLPKLKNITINGMSYLNLSGFQQQRFKLQVTGMSSAIGINNQFKTLRLNCIGRSNIDLRKSLITNVYANVTGKSNVKLNMNGGNLIGEVIGMSSIKYSGHVRKRNVVVLGMSNVTRAN